jgi:hypothetical protein
MDQLELLSPIKATPAEPRRTPREKGAEAAEACLDKACEVAAFDADGAAKFIHEWVVRHGDTRGETLVDEAVKQGFRPHDSRAFGPVISALIRSGQIRCVGYCERTKGHGTAGGRIYGVVR